MRYTIQIKGLEPTADRLESIGQRAANAEPAFEKIIDVLLTSERALWKRSGGKKWDKLANGTKRHHSGRKIMRLSGALEESLTKDRARFNIRKVDGNQLRWGTSLYYAKFHQYGIGVPKREVLVVRPKDKKSVRQIVLEHLTKG